MSKYFNRREYDYVLDKPTHVLIIQLQKRPSYQEWGPQRVSDHFGTSLDTAKNALAYISQNETGETGIQFKADKNFEKKADQFGVKNDYEHFLDTHGIDPEDVVQVYFKGNGDKIDFTVNTRFNQDEKDLDEQRLVHFLQSKRFELPLPKAQCKTYPDTIAVINLYDAHVDKLGHLGEGGKSELERNLTVLKDEFQKILEKVLKDQPNNIIFPIGNDFFNTNGSEPATKKGTPQETSIHWQDAFEAGIDFYRSCIDEIIKYCNVTLISISGNHDSDKTYYLGQVLKGVYGNEPRVKMDMTKNNRKYLFESDVLFGFQHGDIAKNKIRRLPNVMAVEQPENWGEAKYRVWLLGDVHHKEKYTTFSTLEDQGVEIHFFRSATSADTWHYDQMWIDAKKSITAIVFQNSAKDLHTYETIFQN